MRGLLRTGQARAPGIAARIKTERVRGLDRNHCALSPGIRARFAPEYAIGAVLLMNSRWRCTRSH